MQSAIGLMSWQTCPSVCHPWYFIEMNAHIIKIFPSSDKGMTSFLSATAVTKFQGELRQLERKIHGSGTNMRFSTEIAVYLENEIGP